MTNAQPEFLIVGSREMRVIPKGWQHPRDAEGRHLPLLPEGYSFEYGESWPTMPSTSGLSDTEIVAYETTTDGTPISPAFPNTSDGRLALVHWCAEHSTTFGNRRADGEAWAAILFGDAAIALDGSVLA